MPAEAHYQSFDQTADASQSPARLAALRAGMKALGLHGFLIPRADEFQGEYVPPAAERLSYMTGFTGSAGLCIVLADKAALFTDGRYTLQASNQIDTNLIEVIDSTTLSPRDWLAEKTEEGQIIGLDPWLHTIGECKRYTRKLAENGVSIQHVKANLVDRIWADQPAKPTAQVYEHPMHLAGRAAAEKIAALGKQLVKDGHDATILTQPDAIAWLLNIRGGDVAHTPLPLSFAILRKNGPHALYIAGEKLQNPTVKASLSDLVTIKEPAHFLPDLKELATASASIRLDDSLCPQAIHTALQGANLTFLPDICALPKACKNAAEIKGMECAHQRDGLAYTRFLAWFDKQAPSGQLDEIGIVEALETFRRETGALKDVSFETISGAGPHGAIIHYRVTRATNRPLNPGDLFLLDSGAQYQDGTTDITRTLPVGDVGMAEKTAFTCVLKGHIAIATARFPKGTSGAQLDTLARINLWKHGQDFAHGTGHGVGAYLSVHEGPQRISRLGHVALQPGMIISNEPGYYRESAFGIRIENLVVVTEAEDIEGGDSPMLGFRDLTLAPFHQSLIRTDLLSTEEMDWIDAYHEKVSAALTPDLDPETANWLKQATQPLTRS